MYVLHVFSSYGGDNVKIDRKEIGWESVDWIVVSQEGRGTL